MANRTVLVTGGAGYIGSHTCRALAQAGYLPVTLDNLSRGHRGAVRWGPLVEADLVADAARLASVLAEYRPAAVIHFAALAYVGESMQDPGAYFRTNVTGTLNLLEAMQAAELRSIVFSSSCATYGEPASLPVTETCPQRPLSPYGESKLIAERLLHWYGVAFGFTSCILRYFNAAGASPDGEIGENHDPETHLVPRVLLAALGRIPAIEIFGSDYPTPDGSAIRDYIHVQDLADAHVRALDHLLRGGDSIAVNLGGGQGHSVQDVVRQARDVTRRDIPVVERPRRPGDPPALVADITQAKTILGWQPSVSDLETIVRTAWNWHVRAS